MTDLAERAPGAEELTDAELTLRGDAPGTVAGAAVRAVAVDAGLSSERATRLRVLVEQLVAESRDRECVDGADDVTVRTVHGAGDLHVLVHDRRLPLAPGEARRSEARRLVALGFADHLHVRTGADGNHALCVVGIDGDEPAGFDGTEVLADDAAPAPAGDADALEIRAMQPGDAVGLSRCVYRCYGYSYVDPMMYRPRQIRRALRSGLMRSVVAVDPDGQVVGHCALTLERPGDRVPEAGRLVVDPRFRGHHLAERLAAVRLAEAVDGDLPGYWVECVTNHPFSQREVISTGGSETGLLIGAAPADETMAGMENSGSGRHSLLPFAVPVADHGASVVHVPPRHAAFMGGLVTAAGLERRVVTDAVPADGTSALSVGVSSASGLAHLRVEHVGADLVDRVADELEALQAFELAAVHLDLPLAAPATATAAEELERLGFAWAAWVPWFLPDGDALRLQRVGDHAVDIDHIRCARAEGEAVRDHVVAEWHRVQHGR